MAEQERASQATFPTYKLGTVALPANLSHIGCHAKTALPQLAIA
jgi:hypothetical protein